LSQELITEIYQDRSIKRALYPPPGGNPSTSQGGGKTKTAAHWDLCLKVFGEKDEYKNVLAAAKTNKEKGDLA